MLEQLLLEYEKDFFRMAFCREPKNLGGRIHDAFVEFGKSGRIHTKNSTIESLSRLEADRDIEIRDFTVRLSANGIAVAQYLSIVRSTGERALRTSVWVDGDTGWKIILHQGTVTDVQSI